MAAPGKAARNWPCFDALVRSLLDLGMTRRSWCSRESRSGILRTHRMSPRVLIANSNLVPRWATWEHFHELEAKGLMMYGQMTAGLLDLHRHPGDSAGHLRDLRRAGGKAFRREPGRRIVVSAGLGGMGGAQPLAVTMNDGVMICVEVDPRADPPQARHRVPGHRGG